LSILLAPSLIWLFSEAYGADGNDPYVSPLLHKKLNRLPKVYLSVCSHDTLRDDGRLFKAALDDAGYVIQLNLPTEKYLLTEIVYRISTTNMNAIPISSGVSLQNILPSRLRHMRGIWRRRLSLYLAAVASCE
jgi:hypothetical protein